MNFKSVLISFFKENKVDYYLEKEKIYFPCPFCHKTIDINMVKTDWECDNCQLDGNLKTLMDIVKEEGKMGNIKIFHPRREKDEINSMFKRLINKENAKKKDLEVLSDKVNELINYFI